MSCWLVRTECAPRIACGSIIPHVLNTLDRLVVLIDWRQVCGMSSTPLLRVYLSVRRFERLKNIYTIRLQFCERACGGGPVEILQLRR